jgi:hypothetical protein
VRELIESDFLLFSSRAVRLLEEAGALFALAGDVRQVDRS